MCTLVFTMVGITVLAGQVMGYGILAGSLFLQLPQIIKILMAKSVVGLSKRARYAEVSILAASGQGGNVSFFVYSCWSVPSHSFFVSHRVQVPINSNAVIYHWLIGAPFRCAAHKW
jgi:hypothetical protein